MGTPRLTPPQQRSAAVRPTVGARFTGKLTLLLVGVVATAVTGCGSVPGSDAQAAGPVPSGVLDVTARQPAPPVEGETLDGDFLRLADLPGPVVVNFWASWCGPCVEEQPDLVAAAEAYEGSVAFVGVNVKDTRANAQAFVRQFDVPYPSWYDESAALAGAFGGIGPAALPTTMVLDAQHRVAAQFFGAINLAKLSRAVDEVVGTAAPPPGAASDGSGGGG